MPWTTSFDASRGILRIRTEGEYTPAVNSGILRDVVDHALQDACRHILVDHRASDAGFAITAIYSIPDELRKFAVTRQCHLAVVFDMLTTERRFFETVLVNQGFDVRIFTDAGEAVRWLEHGNPPVLGRT